AAIDTEWDWDRALGMPRDRIGELDDLRVRLAARKEDIPLYRILNQPTRFRHMSALAGSNIAKLNKFVKRLRNLCNSEAPSGLLNTVIDHLRENEPPWTGKEDTWLSGEESALKGFDRFSPEAILEEWRGNKGGIRIFHAPTITAYFAARIISDLCEKVLGVDAERIPVAHSGTEPANMPIDTRPAVIVDLELPASRVFPSETLIPRAIYLTGEGISDSPDQNSSSNEKFNVVLAAHRFGSELAGYRPGGGEDEVIVFFDLETTGTDIFRSEIIEIAAVKAHLKGGEVRELGYFHSLVKPDNPIPKSAESVHGITDKDVRDAPHAIDILPRFLEFIGDSPLAGHNIDTFDFPILKRYAGSLLNRVVPNLTLDTLPLSRRLFPGEPHRLPVLAEKFGIDTGASHRALDDVRTNIKLFHRLIEIDEAYRARGFLAELPLMMSVAHAVDEAPDSDPAFINDAAARKLATFEGEIENHPFIKSIKNDLTDSGLKNITGIIKGLARMHISEPLEASLLKERIQMLRDEALRLEDEHPDISLSEYLAHIALLTDGDFDSDEDAVRLMTLHAAKGLEFDRVIIIGMEQGHLPHNLALRKTVQEVEEERRLCYVGLTRARKRAALIYARRREGRWRGKSMFLFELPKISYKLYKTKDRVSGK
ncbi:MAG: exonuclease domain-containing protein, partial [bacterium]|nr:exonuclease domain-containing protein [bacterium]